MLTVGCFNRRPDGWPLYFICLATLTGIVGVFPKIKPPWIFPVPKFPGHAVNIFNLKEKYHETLRMFSGSRSNIVIENGYKYNCLTGVLIGQYLEPDKYNVHSAPLFVYNRTDRFYLLCLRSMPGSQRDVDMCVKMFQKKTDVFSKKEFCGHLRGINSLKKKPRNCRGRNKVGAPSEIQVLLFQKTSGSGKRAAGNVSMQ